MIVKIFKNLIDRIIRIRKISINQNIDWLIDWLLKGSCVYYPDQNSNAFESEQVANKQI